ncbi:energy-coupling factor transporter transmembrane component T family protein [Shouchella shacheensis]|uniref:energy-coupling factor transporter transmembrane component T family protein n=1 Tax=Shouchella shacheensis TaxID=1649580 RepID=UPI0007402291|nr:energy-coupling factor transporter transmembrane component T [Shouchella shacheensis]
MNGYEWRTTWLTRINPSLKLILTLALFIVLVFIHNPNVLVLFFAGSTVLLFAFSGHPIRYVLLYTAPFILIFVSSASAMTFFGQGETTWFEWGLVHITEESFYRGMHLGVRALSFAVLGLLFALTTKPVLLFYSLMQQLKLPSRYAYAFMASIRMLPIMVTEFQTLRHALAIRGLQFRGMRGLYQKLKFFTIPLLAQAIRRSQRIAVAMEAKHFTSQSKRTYFYHTGFSMYDVAFVSIMSLLLAGSLSLGQYQWFVGVHDVRHYQ